MTMTTLDQHSEYVTAVQRACRKARDSRDKRDLISAAALLDSHRFEALPTEVQIDLSAAYGAAMVAVTGALS